MVECTNCGTDFQRLKSRLGETDEFYCEESCQYAYRSEEWQGDGHPMWKGGNVTIYCEFCGDPKEVKPATAKHESRGRFCSRECSYKARRVDRVTVECFWCEETFERVPWLAGRHDREVCPDGDCLSEFLSSIRRGEDNPAWEGGAIEYYGPSWDERSSAIRERDGYECVVCGMSQSDHRDEFGSLLPVHHIVPYRNFDDDSRAHADGNLITLCRVCHADLEQMTAPQQRQEIRGWADGDD
jgi:hypothetical protein